MHSSRNPSRLKTLFPPATGACTALAIATCHGLYISARRCCSTARPSLWLVGRRYAYLLLVIIPHLRRCGRMQRQHRARQRPRWHPTVMQTWRWSPPCPLQGGPCCRCLACPILTWPSFLRQVRQKAKAAQSPAAAALAPHSDADMEVVPSAAPAGGPSSSSGAKPAKEWSDIDLSSPQQ